MAPVEGGRPEIESAWGHDAGRLLALLREQSDSGVTVRTMRERGIDAPAQAIYTLQIAGFAIDRVPAPVADGRGQVYRLRGHH